MHRHSLLLLAVLSPLTQAMQALDDQALSSEYLFRAALLLEISGKNDEAVKTYQELKQKFPRTEKGYSAEKYLARLGALN